MNGPNDNAGAAATAVARYCRSCRHNLLDVTLGVCPECGTAFNPADPDSTWPTPHSPTMRDLGGLVRVMNKVWAVMLGGCVVVCGLVLVDAFILGMLVVWVVPVGIAMWWPTLDPRVPITLRARAFSMLAPVVLFATIMTYWPLAMTFALHRPWFNRAADAVERSGPLGGGSIGVLGYRRALSHAGSVGFQLTGDDGSGAYVVRDRGSRSYHWPGGAVLTPLGGDWYLVYED